MSRSHQRITNIDSIILDPPPDLAGTLARDVAHAAQRSRLSQIQNQPMRMIWLCVAPLRVPEVGGLAVDSVLGRAVFANAFFGIDVGDRPALVAQRFAAFVEKIHLGNGREGFAVLGADGFDAEVAPAGARVELNLLDLRARFELACFYRLNSVQRQLYLWPARPREIQIRSKLAQNRFLQPRDHRFLRAEQIENYNLIRPGLEPAP